MYIYILHFTSALAGTDDGSQRWRKRGGEGRRANRRGGDAADAAQSETNRRRTEHKAAGSSIKWRPWRNHVSTQSKKQGHTCQAAHATGQCHPEDHARQP